MAEICTCILCHEQRERFIRIKIEFPNKVVELSACQSCVKNKLEQNTAVQLIMGKFLPGGWQEVFNG